MNQPYYFEAKHLMSQRDDRPNGAQPLSYTLRLALRNKWLIIACWGLAVLAASAYCALLPPGYVAQAQLLFDPKLPSVFREANDLGLNLDAGQVETHIVALKSRAIATAVVARMKLAEDPDFAPRPSLRARLPVLRDLWPAAPAVDPTQLATDIFLRNLRVERDGISQVVDVSYTSSDPRKAALLANATASAYIDYLIGVRADAARTASAWLDDRLQQLRIQMNQAAKRAQNYRASAETASLEELQLSAETYRKVYQDFYAAFAEAVQRESYPVSTVRLISEASVPTGRSSPNVPLVFGVALLLGSALGLLLSLLRDGARTGEGQTW